MNEAKTVYQLLPAFALLEPLPAVRTRPNGKKFGQSGPHWRLDCRYEPEQFQTEYRALDMWRTPWAVLNRRRPPALERISYLKPGNVSFVAWRKDNPFTADFTHEARVRLIKTPSTHHRQAVLAAESSSFNFRIWLAGTPLSSTLWRYDDCEIQNIKRGDQPGSIELRLRGIGKSREVFDINNLHIGSPSTTDHTSVFFSWRVLNAGMTSEPGARKIRLQLAGEAGEWLVTNTQTGSQIALPGKELPDGFIARH